jgi:hypothetical protein
MSAIDSLCTITSCHHVQKLGRGMCRALEEGVAPRTKETPKPAALLIDAVVEFEFL